MDRQTIKRKVHEKDFDRYDVSLLNEALRREEERLRLVVRHENLEYWQRIGLIVLTWTGVLCTFALGLFLCIKMFSYLGADDPLGSYRSSPEAVVLEPKPANIQTSYTQFIREFLLSGETLVTGKTFEPGNNQAVSQYCYLESIGGSASIGANYLAELLDGEVVFYTTESDLREMVTSKCQFDFYGPVE